MYASPRCDVGKMFLLAYDAFTQILIEVVQLYYSAVCFRSRVALSKLERRGNQLLLFCLCDLSLIGSLF
jgi:hypothetical protein